MEESKFKLSKFKGLIVKKKNKLECNYDCLVESIIIK